MSANNLNAVRALLNQALYLLNAHAHDDGGGGTNESATEPGQATAAQNSIGGQPADNCSSNADAVPFRRKCNTPWTSTEERLLLSGLPLSDVAAITGRTRHAAKNRKRRLLNPDIRALDRRQSQAIKEKHQAETTPAPRKRQRWAPEEDAALNNHHLTDTEIASQIGRSYKAVLARRNALRAKQMRGAK